MQERREAGSVPGWERSPGGGHGNPLQYSCLETPVDRGACGLQPMGSQSWTRLKGFSMHARCTHQGEGVSLAGQQCKGPEARPGTEGRAQGCRVPEAWTQASQGRPASVRPLGLTHIHRALQGGSCLWECEHPIYQSDLFEVAECFEILTTPGMSAHRE